MYKIMRLALANIRRHKSESILLGILIMLCMALLGGAIPAEKSANRIFPELWERTGFCKALIALKDEVDPELALEVLTTCMGLLQGSLTKTAMRAFFPAHS